ncbi:BrnT family toxin [Rhodoferax sp.]|uniref:BrnT family toxin n=1 Tax=Rhodoferax sp. TaxID=50421 RepID=UPI00261561C2|nr:BrnT family toxin [Rhodoferax sp.]MDD2810314.1 BrnT family toxin [Rhodoferax sp.]
MATWNETKRNLNINKHGLDFVGCEAIFDTPVSITEDASEAYGEQRLNAIGWLQGLVVCMTYTERGEDFQVISLRKAEKHEVRQFIKDISN